MSRKLKKNGFVEGTLIAYLCIVLTKLLGAFYIIPFYSIIGETGGFIYSCTYSIYNLVYNISTSGIPIAMSILIAEYNTKGMYAAKTKLYRTGLAIIGVISAAVFIFLQLFANDVGRFFMDTMEDTSAVSVADIASGVRAVSVCILIVPFLSIKRGYLQGHKLISVSSISQVAEQIVRIAIVLLGSYITVTLMGMHVVVGIDIALLGAAAGAIAALVYMMLCERRADIKKTGGDIAPPTKLLIKRILACSIPVVIVAVSTNLIEIADAKFVISGLKTLGYSDEDTQLISSIISSLGPRICALITSLTFGLTASLIPAMSSHFAKGEITLANQKLNRALNMIIYISVPLAIGIALLSSPVYQLFYGLNDYGPFMLKFLVVISVITSVKDVLGMAMQGMGKTTTVIISTLSGIAANLCIAYPLTIAFGNTGLPGYLGVMLAMFIGHGINIVIIMITLHQKSGFNYKSVWSMMIRSIVPNIGMIAVVLLLGMFIPIPATRGIVQIIYLAIYGIAGAAVYFALSYVFGGMQMVFGDNILSTVKNKLLRKN